MGGGCLGVLRGENAVLFCRHTGILSTESKFVCSSLVSESSRHLNMEFERACKEISFGKTLVQIAQNRELSVGVGWCPIIKKSPLGQIFRKDPS